MADKIGRRKTLLIGFVVCYVGVTLEVVATSMAVFFVGRLLVGLGIGSCNSIALCYIAEVRRPHARLSFRRGETTPLITPTPARSLP